MNKKYKIKQFTLRIDEELLAKLHYITDYEDRSANKEILRLIRAHVKAFEAEHGEIKLDEL